MTAYESRHTPAINAILANLGDTPVYLQINHYFEVDGVEQHSSTFKRTYDVRKLMADANRYHLDYVDDLILAGLMNKVEVSTSMKYSFADSSDWYALAEVTNNCTEEEKVFSLDVITYL